MKILTANDLSHFQRRGGYRQVIQQNVCQLWGGVAPTINWDDVQRQVVAFVIRSQWVAECPYCHDVSVVQPGEPFFCQFCAMQGNDYKPMALAMPDHFEEAVKLLVARPNPMNRNWVSDETIAQLKEENEREGVNQ